MANKKEARAFCNLIYQLTSHYFCYILIIRNGPLGVALLRGEEVTKDVSTMSQDSLECLRGCLLQCVFVDPIKTLVCLAA